jgi:uncharacterized protein (DUF302 family)
MKMKTRDVKSATKTVATVDTPIYDTLAEAVEKETEAKVLELFNAQNATNIMNAARAAATNVPSKSKIKDEILFDLTTGKLDSDPTFVEAKADTTRLMAWMEKEVERRLAEYKAKLPTPKEDENNGEE